MTLAIFCFYCLTAPPNKQLRTAKRARSLEKEGDWADVDSLRMKRQPSLFEVLYHLCYEVWLARPAASSVIFFPDLSRSSSASRNKAGMRARSTFPC